MAEPAQVPAAEHYRPAENPGHSCATCRAFAAGVCTMFPGNPPVSPSHVCDAWEARPTATHLPVPVGADHHNAVLAAARARVDELEEDLVAALTPILLRAGDEAARNFEKYATNHLTAAGPLSGVQPTSTMIAVRPRPEEAQAIADPDGAPATDLHITLAYLGEIEGSLQRVVEAVAPVAGKHGPLAGRVGGYGEFRPPGCGILLPDVPGLVELRVAVTEMLTQAGISYGRDHGFQPHITVDGSPEPGEADEMLERASGAPLHFDALLVVRGDVETIELPLVGPRPITASLCYRCSKEPAVAFVGYPICNSCSYELVAAGDTPRPDWHPPAGDELVDTDALASMLRGKTDPIRLALIQEVLGSAFGTPGVTEAEAIAFYHSPSAFELNEALRSGKPLTAEQQAIVNALDKAMAPSEAPMTLWRGWPDAASVFKGDIADSSFRTAGYLSTSETMETAEQFAGGIAGPGDTPIVMRIDVPKGTPMLRIPAGDFGDQQEWLLPREVSLAVGDVSSYEDPFGERALKAQASATSHGVLSTSHAGVATGAGLSFDVSNPLIDGVLADTGKHIVGIADTTRANVMRAVGSSYDQGLSIPDTAKVIRQVMDEAAPKRAIMIARTEMTSAVNGASLAAARLVGQQLGTKMTKTWLTAPGAQYPRHEEYDDLDGQTVPEDATFTVGEDELQFPGDPDGSPEEVINCRCAMTYSDGSEVEAE